MAAFDFPPTPAVGTLYPAVAEVGKPQYRWNGNEWLAATFDPAGYVRKSGDSMSGALSLAGDPTQALHAVPKQYLDNKFQRVSLAGGKSFDIPVPSGALSARMNGFIAAGTATGITAYIKVSTSPGVFFGLGDYRAYGYYHNTSGGAVISIINALQYDGLFLSDTHANAALSLMFTGSVLLKRPNATVTVIGDFDGFSFSAAAGIHTHAMSYVNSIHGTDVLALRIHSTTGDNWLSSSHVNIEWVF